MVGHTGAAVALQTVGAVASWSGHFSLPLEITGDQKPRARVWMWIEFNCMPTNLRLRATTSRVTLSLRLVVIIIVGMASHEDGSIKACSKLDGALTP